MPTSRALAKQIIVAYAEALFEAASASGTVDAVGGQIEQVRSIVRGHTDLRDALLDAQVPAASRAGIVKEVFASFDPALLTVLSLMAERGEFDLLSSLAETYTVVAEEKRDIVTVDVTTVVDLTDELRTALSRKLSADMGKQITLREKVDPSIVGGIIISTHGQRLDASIASQLEAARATLSTAHTGGDA